MRAGRQRTLYFLLALLILTLFFFSAGRILVVDSPERSGVILVLAGETDHRPARGLELLNQGYARRLVIDVPAASRLYNVSEVDLARTYIQALPQAAAIDICPIVGLSTRAETHDVERCLAGTPSSHVLIVTSDFHTRRALSIFRHELPGRSFSIAASHDDAQFGVRWWTHRQWAKVCLEEWMRFIWWNAVDRWR
ncbi:MAG TPA: ElyC/SanA/YdcF family protein [Candidatus Eisenbacteria bacterium]|nr:ElyC/SanA/YdcF family protein [Candidatus Eisenbacteria bacterium]